MGRPDVSADAIVGFDHHSDEFDRNELAINAELRSRCPVAWNEKYGQQEQTVTVGPKEQKAVAFTFKGV